jgi:hypothetical protein
MSAPVDVLAVVDAAIGRSARPHEAGLHAARDAIAELIDADKEYHRLLASIRAYPAGHTEKALHKAEKRCAAALANTGGAA